MARPSISVDDELLEEFDRAINRRKAIEKLPQDADRSSVMRMLMREFVQETDEMWGNSTPAAMAPAES